MKPSLLLCIFISIAFFTIAGQSAAQKPDLSSWRFESPRPQIAPRNWVDKSVKYNGQTTLALSGGGKSYSDGRWVWLVTVEPGAYYHFETHYRCSKVDEPLRTVLARIVWLDARGESVVPADYPASRRGDSPGGWRRIEQTYRCPERATQARLELMYRWDADGSVHFVPAVLEKTGMPAPRLVRLATVKYRPPNSSSARQNLERFAKFIEQAADRKADVVCLPEGITFIGTGKSYMEAAEPVPGPSTEFLGNVARANRLYIVAGLIERDNDLVYNTAVLLDREGRLAGTYRKVCLPRDEIDGGVTPGDEFRVFDTDFGRIGIMICWDVAFPEPARELALEGAEVIFLPIWGGHTLLARARALENQVYLVSSSYDMETGIFDKEGNLAVQASEENPVVVLEVDLDKKKDWFWDGDFKNRFPREMPPRKALRSHTGQ